MRRLLVAAVLALATAAVAVPLAWAGSPHFVGSGSAVKNADGSLTVSAKEAGLGDEAQINVTISATAECINPGQKHPKAANKESVSTTTNEPVQNGKSDYSETLVATTISPNCSPPMTIVWTDVTVTDNTNHLTLRIPGTF
jgi:hypothetical protein